MLRAVARDNHDVINAAAHVVAAQRHQQLVGAAVQRRLREVPLVVGDAAQAPDDFRRKHVLDTWVGGVAGRACGDGHGVELSLSLQKKMCFGGPRDGLSYILSFSCGQTLFTQVTSCLQVSHAIVAHPRVH